VSPRFHISIHLRALALAGLALLATVLMPLSAGAHPIGDKWPTKPPGHATFTLKYERDCVYSVQPNNGPIVWGRIPKAAAAWTQTPTPVVIFETPTLDCSGKPVPNRVRFYAYHDQDDYYLAYTVNYAWGSNSVCGPIGCYTWTQLMSTWSGKTAASVLWMNNSKSPQQGTIVHELGHTLGLDHAGYYAGEKTGGYSIMDYACCRPGDVPAQHDINDINALYPGW